jgi:hypothetical protein
VKVELEAAQKKDLRFKIQSIYQDGRGEWHRKDLGLLHTVKKTNDDAL